MKKSYAYDISDFRFVTLLNFISEDYMNKFLRMLILPLTMVGGNSVMAAYPGFNSGYICNGYPTAEGIIDLYTPTQTYKSNYGVYVRMVYNSGRQYGGVIYPRSSTEYAYKQLTSVAMISLIAKMCYSGDDVYALELKG